MISPKKKAKIQKLELKAFSLHVQGFDLRTIGEKLGKSHQWAKLAIDKVKVIHS